MSPGACSPPAQRPLADIRRRASPWWPRRRPAVLGGAQRLREPRRPVPQRGRVLGVDAVLLDPPHRLIRSACRSVRVSMGHVLRSCSPCSRATWPASLSTLLHRTRLHHIRADPCTHRLQTYGPRSPRRIAAQLRPCAEGPGLTARPLAVADHRVRIPMAAGVDSLNVATAAAVAFAHLTHCSTFLRFPPPPPPPPPFFRIPCPCPVPAATTAYPALGVPARPLDQRVFPRILWSAANRPVPSVMSSPSRRSSITPSISFQHEYAVGDLHGREPVVGDDQRCPGLASTVCSARWTARSVGTSMRTSPSSRIKYRWDRPGTPARMRSADAAPPRAARHACARRCRIPRGSASMNSCAPTA